MISGKIFNTALAALMASTVAAQACECRVPAGSAAGPIGQIVSAGGEVLASTPAGLELAAAGTDLYSGSQIIVGNDSAANISVGATCHLPLEANSETTIANTDGELCVRVSKAAQVISEEQTFGQTSQVTPPIVPLLVIGGTAAAVIAFGGGDDGGSD